MGTPVARHPAPLPEWPRERRSAHAFAAPPAEGTRQRPFVGRALGTCRGHLPWVGRRRGGGVVPCEAPRRLMAPLSIQKRSNSAKSGRVAAWRRGAPPGWRRPPSPHLSNAFTFGPCRNGGAAVPVLHEALHDEVLHARPQEGLLDGGTTATARGRSAATPRSPNTRARTRARANF